MKFVAAEFVTSAARANQFPEDGLPELALVGRSNVGKSSLINRLLGHAKLARTSNTPGRTQTLNWYRVWPEGRPQGADEGARGKSVPQAVPTAERPAFYFVDMPGYGYAKVSQTMRKQWQQLIETYLLQRSVLKGTIQIVDLRHPPTEDDQLMCEWLRYHDIPRLVVATKQDKLPPRLVSEQVRQVEQALGVKAPQQGQWLPAADGLATFSAETGAGRDALWGWVLATSGLVT